MLNDFFQMKCTGNDEIYQPIKKKIEYNFTFVELWWEIDTPKFYSRMNGVVSIWFRILLVKPIETIKHKLKVIWKKGFVWECIGLIVLFW
jgi:hypothetical protein